MKDNPFNKVIDKYLKEFLYTPSDDLEHLEKFYTTPQIDMTNYHEWGIFSTPIFGIHYYSFWYNPNYNDFEKIIDSFAMSFIAQIMYLYDNKQRFIQVLPDAVPLFLAILTFANRKEIDLMFNAVINLIHNDISNNDVIDHRDKTLQEAFLIYDLYTDNKNHKIWEMYIEIPLHENYKRYLDVILSNDEKDVSSILSEMMKYHKKTAHIESFTKNEFYPIEWRVFPIEIIILIRFRYLYGHSIDFITHEVLSKFIPFLKRKEYPLTPAIKNAINKMYIQLSL
mgnify:CR=1 FL=1